MVHQRQADGFATELETQPLLSDRHPGLQAVAVVRDALSAYDVPSQVRLRYTGMNRHGGSGAYHMTDGVVWVQAELQSLSSAKHYVDIPVIVVDRRMVQPEVLLHRGRTRVMAQSTFDDIIGNAEVHRAAPDRKHLYSLPPSRERPPAEPTPVTNAGMFGVAAQRNSK